MKFFSKYILLVGVVLSQMVPSYAQNINLETTSSTEYPSTEVLSVEERQQLIRNTEILLNEYAEAATLLDSTRMVSGKSIDRFQALFSPLARIVKED